MVQVKEPKVSSNLWCHYTCMGCSEEFEFRWQTCKLCSYAVAKITSAGSPLGSIAQGNANACRAHTFEFTAGPFPQCPKCQSSYAKWTNYTPPKYNWVNKRDLKV